MSVPFRRRQRFVPRADLFSAAPSSFEIDLDEFRSDVDAIMSADVLDPYER